MAGGAPPCTHRPTCPGCPRYGAGEIAPRALARLRALATSLAAPPPEVVSGAFFAYRHRARLMVRGRAGSPKVGLFQEGSHRIADIPRCRIHHPLINRVAAAVRDAMRHCGVEPYAEVPHRGSLRAIQVVVERATDSAQVVLVENAREPAAAATLRHELERALGDALQALYWNGNPQRTNSVLGPHWTLLCGSASLVEELGGARVHFLPETFGQSNLPLFDRMLEQIHHWVHPEADVTELYAGGGAIGLSLLVRGARRLVFNERSEAGLSALTLGLGELDAEIRARAEILPGDAAAVRGGWRHDSTVIVDPPRKGLDAQLLDALCHTPPARLIALSCGLDAFEREAPALVDAGLALHALRAYDLFPHTEHIETLALYERTL